MLYTDEKLTNHTTAFRLVTDRDTGKAKVSIKWHVYWLKKASTGELSSTVLVQGYAFAEYFDVATAQSAQRILSGTEVAGRPLRVDFADHESKSLHELSCSISRTPSPQG